MSYNPKHTQFLWKHDYQDTMPYEGCKTFSIRIFQWIPMASTGKQMKQSKCLVRVHGNSELKKSMIAKCEEIIALLDAGLYQGNKNITIKDTKTT